jgi:small-conductance mechanosensitive channel
VVFSGETLLVVRARLGPFSAEERAAAVAARLARLSARIATGADSVAVVDAEGSTDLLVGDAVLMSVTDADARAADRPRTRLAQDYARTLTRALRVGSRLAIAKALTRGLFWTAVATAGLILLLRVGASLLRSIDAKIELVIASRLRGISVQKFEIVSARRLTELLLGAGRVVRVIALLVLLYFYLVVDLSVFPWTQHLAGSILGYVLDPLSRAWQGFVDYLPSAFSLAVIAVITRYALKLVHLLFRAVESGALSFRGFHAEWGEPTYKIVRFLILAFAVVVAFPYLPGARSDAFKGVSLFLGVLFSLGSSSAIGNVVAGVVLTYTRAFRVGDRVRVGETTGDVVEKTLLVTRVRTIKNEDITIPNAIVLGSHITNYSAVAKDAGLILHTAVTIGYDAPWRQVHALLHAAARATTGILAKPAPFVLQTSLDDFYVTYELNASTDQPAAMARTYSELHQNIQDRFNEAGVEIMSPHYGAHRDGNRTAIPDDNLPAGYRAPAFRVSPIDSQPEQPARTPPTPAG